MSIAWKPVSRVALFSWIACYGAFLVYAAFNKSGFLFLDQVNLIVHEAGHLLFGWLGRAPGLWGGTLFELMVPALLAGYFVVQLELTGFAFCCFVFFENFLYIATYMADARVQQLPLVTVGDPGLGGHDWFAIFSSLGLLQHDVAIARLVRMLGWIGMLATVAYLWVAATASRADNRE